MVAKPARSRRRYRGVERPAEARVLYSRPRGRATRGPRPAARAVDGDLRARHRPLAHPRPRPRDRRALLLRHRRRDQRVRGRVPDPEHRARARRRRRALVGVRPGLQRAAGQGRARSARGASRRASSGSSCSGSAASPRCSSCISPWIMARVRLRTISPSGSRASSSRSSCCSACRGSSSGSSTATTTSPSRRSRRSFWNIAIIVGLVIGVPRADGISAQLYVYAFSILIATVIQFLLPLPWLRGRDGRLQVVIDWRDPAVRQTLRADGPDHDRPRADQLQRASSTRSSPRA